MKKQAVKVTNQAQFDCVVADLKKNGFKPFEIGMIYQQGYLSLEDNYVFVGSKYMDNYGLMSFEDFLRMEVVPC